MGNNLGTYNYGEFSNNTDELERLKRQAKVAWSIEESYLAAHGLRDGMIGAALASGPGFISRLIKRELCPAGKVIGVELNESLLALARKLASDTERPPEFRAGDV